MKRDRFLRDLEAIQVLNSHSEPSSPIFHIFRSPCLEDGKSHRLILSKSAILHTNSA